LRNKNEFGYAQEAITPCPRCKRSKSVGANYCRDCWWVISRKSRLKPFSVNKNSSEFE